MTKIFVNGQATEVAENLTIRSLLQHLGYTHDCYAVAKNMRCIPQPDFEQEALEPGDRIEILAPMAGG